MLQPPTAVLPRSPVGITEPRGRGLLLQTVRLNWVFQQPLVLFGNPEFRDS